MRNGTIVFLRTGIDLINFRFGIRERMRVFSAQYLDHLSAEMRLT